MINKWNFQTPTEEELRKRDALAAEIGFSPIICLLLVQRGITTQSIFWACLSNVELENELPLPVPWYLPGSGKCKISDF